MARFDTAERTTAGLVASSVHGPVGRSVPSAKRPDIQGLRAVAVVSVAANHFANWPKSGFVGVDVFFVISGFLITGLLLREHDRTGTISFRGFYIRRIKRILPNALLVLAVTAIASQLILPRTRYVEQGVDTIWAALFAGNWRFALKSTDYFAQGELPSAVQHFWSLGVEEQFYLVWPWVMLGLLAIVVGRLHRSHRSGRATAALAIGALSLVSFVWAIHESSTDISFAYFSTFDRAWELGAGALLAAAVPRLLNDHCKVLRAVVAWVGLTGIVISLFVVPSSHGFPAPWAALPVLSTCAVIGAGIGTERLFIWPLTNRVAMFFGDISYSLYLWHFPVAVLLVAYLPADSLRYYLAGAALTLLCSVVAYVAVERPVHMSTWLTAVSRTPAWRPAALAGVAIAAVVTGLVVADLQSSSAGPIVRSGDVAGQACYGAAARAPQHKCTTSKGSGIHPSVDAIASDIGYTHRCFSRPSQDMKSCTFGSRRADATRVALVGDSHAADLIPGLERGLTARNWRLDTFNGDGCDWSANLAGHCSVAMKQIQARLATSHYAIVVTAADVQFSGDVPRRSYVAAWTAIARTGARIVVIRDRPTSPQSTLECVERVTGNPDDCSTPRSRALRPDPLVDAARSVPRAKVVDLTPFYCDTRECPAVIGHVVVHRDTYGHVTGTWSRTLGPYLIAAIARTTEK